MVGFHELAWRIPRLCFWFMVGLTVGSRRFYLTSKAVSVRPLVTKQTSGILHLSARPGYYKRMYLIKQLIRLIFTENMASPRTRGFRHTTSIFLLHLIITAMLPVTS
jgi:hypothetical protein